MILRTCGVAAPQKHPLSSLFWLIGRSFLFRNALLRFDGAELAYARGLFSDRGRVTAVWRAMQLEKLAMAQRDGRHDIAIIGAGAVLPPDGAGVSSFLDLIETGGDAIIDVPQDRWVHDDHYDADASVPDKSYARIGGFVQNAPFKSFEFRIPPRSLTASTACRSGR